MYGYTQSVFTGSLGAQNLTFFILENFQRKISIWQCYKEKAKGEKHRKRGRKEEKARVRIAELTGARAHTHRRIYLDTRTREHAAMRRRARAHAITLSWFAAATSGCNIRRAPWNAIDLAATTHGSSHR